MNKVRTKTKKTGDNDTPDLRQITCFHNLSLPSDKQLKDLSGLDATRFSASAFLHPAGSFCADLPRESKLGLVSKPTRDELRESEPISFALRTDLHGICI